MGRATWPCWRGVAARPISIHALREEGDFAARRFSYIRRLFQSTPSARRATFRLSFRWSMLAKFQSTPSARRATSAARRTKRHSNISIHALREEGDLSLWDSATSVYLFQSTPSARRATLRQAVAVQHYYISIHALREEGDATRSSPCSPRCYFNPCPPRGGRRPFRRQRPRV